MELAGLVIGVVGAMPVLVEVVEGYRIIVEVAHVKRHMADLGQDLRTEKIILKNTYECLLDNIVSASELETLTQMEPQTPKWQRYDRKIRARLQGSFDVFQKQTEDMHNAVAELQQKLGIDAAKRETKLKSWPSMLSEIKMRTRFTLRKKDYNDTICRIREANVILERLVKHSTSSEPNRRARSQNELAQKVRNLTEALFFAIRESLGCNCSRHSLGLQLQTLGLLDEWEDRSGESPNFNIILGSRSHETIQQWDGINIHFIKGNQSVTVLDHNSLQSSPSTDSNVDLRTPLRGTSSGLNKLRTKFGIEDNSIKTLELKQERSGKKVRFSLPECSQVKDGSHTYTLETGALQSHTGKPTPITSLCHILQKGKSPDASKCFIGSIASSKFTTRFNLHREQHPRVSKSITLKEALLGTQAGLRDFDISERLHIALSLSISILHLCNTPWLKQVLTLDDFVFLRQDEESDLYDFNLGRPCPFLSSQLTNEAPLNTTVKSSSLISGRRPVNFPLLCLGLLLTYIIAGHPIQEIEVGEHMSKELLYSAKDFALRQVIICDNASENYEEAVQWCLNKSFTFATLEDEGFSRAFYSKVIAGLEKDLYSLSSYGLGN